MKEIETKFNIGDRVVHYDKCALIVGIVCAIKIFIGPQGDSECAKSVTYRIRRYVGDLPLSNEIPEDEIFLFGESLFDAVKCRVQKELELLSDESLKDEFKRKFNIEIK